MLKRHPYTPTSKQFHHIHLSFRHSALSSCSRRRMLQMTNLLGSRRASASDASDAWRFRKKMKQAEFL